MIKDIIIHRRDREGSGKGKYLNHPPDALEALRRRGRGIILGLYSRTHRKRPPLV